jgi:cellulose biosynthesis protein BcsQ
MNTKGGVGKSTVSTQIVAPYLYKVSKERVTYYEFDDENDDSQSFYDCDILDIQQVRVDKTDLRDKLADILLEDKSVCIDIGANKTTTYLFNAFLDSGMINVVDMIVIPLMDGEVDAISALNLYANIREVNSNIKIVFALNRVNKSRDINTQFEVFLGDKRGFFDSDGIIEQIQEGDKNIISVIDSDAVKQSRKFGCTIWELARVEKNLDEEIKQAISNNVNKEDIKFLSYKKCVQRDCIEYYNEVLRPAFHMLNKLLGVLVNE